MKKVLKSLLIVGSLSLLGSVCVKNTDTNVNVAQNANVIVNTNSVVNTNVEVNVNEVVNTNLATNTNTSTVDTSDWLTYTNEEYGFSFRYPKSWTITEMNKWDCVELASSELITYNEEWTKKNTEAAQIGTDAVKTYDINICRKENRSNLSLDSWIEENVDSAWVVSKQNIKFNDLNAVEIVTNALGIWTETYILTDTSIIRISRLKKPVVIDSNFVEKVISTIKLVQ